VNRDNPTAAAGAGIPTEDAELVRQIASAAPGQASEAEAELYRRMAPRVRLYGIRHLRDEHAAQDLAHEVLLIVFEALRAGRLREPERFVSFVLGTCRMVVLNIRRNATRREDLLERYRGEFPQLSYSAAPELDRGQLRRCLEALPERERSVVVMSYFDEQSAMEVATFLAISPANVRVIRHRALQRLRGCISGGKANDRAAMQ
jgi:RNA polymerase sigma-70 factor (ECF subfamily)